MKKSKLLVISGILSAIYLFCILNYFIGGILLLSGFTIISSAVISVLIIPHIFFVGLAFIFNWIGWAMKLRWAALVAGILYAVSILLMFIFGIFVIIQMILCFVAFSKMKNIYY